ncbi:MAG TPA: hypothetical protein PLV58_00360 [Campylobacterales bacterium]|nr:hypothetical protein [Campylobacterales bacterium]
MFEKTTKELQDKKEETKEQKPKSIYADINADDGTSYEMSKRYQKKA